MIETDAHHRNPMKLFELLSSEEVIGDELTSKPMKLYAMLT